MTIKQQKYIIALSLLSVNIILSTTCIIYEDKWYVYLFLLALASIINAFSCISIIMKYTFFSLTSSSSSSSSSSSKYLNNNELSTIILKNNRIKPLNYLYIIPCYNETEEELSDTIHSLILQRYVPGDKRSLLIICDGKVKGSGNQETTDKILIKILKINNITSEYYTYTTWDKRQNMITLFKGVIKNENEFVPFILFIKNSNYGKRDSLVLARSCCYKYNLSLNKYENKNENKNENVIYIAEESAESAESAESQYADVESRELADQHLINIMIHNLGHIYKNKKIHYIIGIDADTIFDYNCSYELIKSIEKDEQIHGCVGFVDISPLMNKFSLFVLYQYAEYIFAQCLRRYTQSNITNKVSCLSGCVQILRVSEETCGEKILSIFNYLPKEEEHILKHIRSYASEDRNHVCHMLSLYPEIKTIQNVNAISYTKVPTSIKVFISQRRRWCLGANSNDMLLVYLPGINFFERISAFVNVLTFSISPFVFIATALFIKSIIENPTMLMLYLSIVIIIPFSYAIFIIPIFIKRFSVNETLYFYLSYLFFNLFGSIVNLFIYFYSLMCMDVIKWGKTRTIINNDQILNKETDHDVIEEEKEEIDEKRIIIKYGNTQNDYYFDDLQGIVL